MKVFGILLVEVRCAGSGTSGGLQGINLGSREIRLSVRAPHGVKLVMCEAGFSWSEVSRGVHGVDLCSGEIRWPRSERFG